MTKKVAPIAPETRVGVAGFTMLGTVVARVAANLYSVRLDDGRTFPVSRANLSRWDAKAGRGFKF